MQPATTTIDGHVFTIPLIAPWDSFLLAPELVPIVGEILPAALRAREQLALAAVEKARQVAKDGGKVDALDVNLGLDDLAPALDAILPALARVCSAMPRDKLDRIARTLLDPVQMDGKPLFTEGASPINVFLAGKPSTIWRLLIAAVRENFADFFALLPAKGPAGQKEASPSAT